MRSYGAQLAQKFVNLALEILKKYKEKHKKFVDLASHLANVEQKSSKLAPKILRENTDDHFMTFASITHVESQMFP